MNVLDGGMLQSVWLIVDTVRCLKCFHILYTVCPKRHEIYFFAALLLVAACSNRLVEVGGTLIFIAHQRSVCCENQKDRDS